MEPRVAIVIVTWNKKNDVINLLNSLRNIKYTDYTIVVVDNASEDDSVEAIKAHDVDVHLIENTENLGGTGGFNTGIRYALSSLEQKYIWLLDNDAEVTPDTLLELVSAMEGDDSIGIAGSCIMSPEDRDLIVEAGAFVDWNSGTWAPNFRYMRRSEVKAEGTIPVDYVAACSALVRSSVARQLDGMDDRYFLHWDDIDFCLSIGGLGYKRVAVWESKVYHGVEKGFNPQVLYYDFRNGLITISKHLDGVIKLRAYMSLCFNAFAVLVLEILMGRSKFARLVFLSVRDFVVGNYGKAGLSIPFTSGHSVKTYSENEVLINSKKIILFADGAYDEVIETCNYIQRIAPDNSLTFCVSSEKQGLFHSIVYDDVILVNNFKDSIFKKACNALKILRGQYDCGISCPSKLNNPYLFMVKKNYIYDLSTGHFTIADKSISSVWKVPLAVIGGVIGTLICLPFVWFAGLKERRI